MPIKHLFVLSVVVSGLWLRGGLDQRQASPAAAESTLPEVAQRQPSSPSSTAPQPPRAPPEANKPQAPGGSPATGPAHDPQLCEVPEGSVARCEPPPGSPFSAFPLVLNVDRPPSLPPA